MERWQQIESLFQEALERDPAERNAWLREACQGDSDLRREVASLLANHQAATDSRRWAAAAAAQLIDKPASLEPGQCLGPYRIECFLAAGGMGKVYRATDTRLQRHVAIKISAARFSERFQREARVIASLNHPHICQLYDVGPNYLVMELVEGPTLAERIREGALPLDEALAIARQIAEALEAAHEKGIVHRDLKPANVKITPAGLAKVLDFGLAKAAEEPAANAGDPSDSPTQTLSATRTGVILGTAAYMSPEQARGSAVDKRADIWAFGCVLYEMLTGKPGFSGETTSDILAAVLRAEPDWSVLSAAIPPRIRRLLQRCLERDHKQRLQAIGEARITIEAPGEDVVPQPAGSRSWPWIAAAMSAIALALIAAAGWWGASHSAPLRPLIQLSADLPPGTTINRFLGPELALSPDGIRIAVVEWDMFRKYTLAMRRLDQREFSPLSGTEGASWPFFSPDGQWIGFFAGLKLKKISVQGGSPVTLCDLPVLSAGASWGDGSIVVAFRSGPTRLVRVPSGGGAPTPVTELSQEKDERAHRWPQVLPGSQAVLFTNVGESSDDASIDVLSLTTGQSKTVLQRGFFGRYLAISNVTGYLVYLQQSALYAVPFDLRKLAVTGAGQPVLEDVNSSTSSRSGTFDFSQTGNFVYASGNKTGLPELSIFWLDSAGQAQPLLSTSGDYRDPRFSPDGNRLAFRTITAPGRTDIWVSDLARDATSRVTSLPGDNIYPVWTPDSKNIVFASRNQPSPGVYWIHADGSGEPQRLTDGKTMDYPSSFSPDGKRLALSRSTAEGRLEIWTVSVEGDRDQPRLGKAELFVRTSGSVRLPVPAFSPDGRWLAYASNETGRSEVYVRPFPGPGSLTQISTSGGWFPVWSRNGRELFFLGPDQHIMVAVYTGKGDSFAAGKPHVWSPKSVADVLAFIPYDLAPDGKRFAVLLYPGGTAEPGQKPVDGVTVLLNFFDELKRRVPVGGK
jgi:serine/threonine-protein kinase